MKVRNKTNSKKANQNECVQVLPAGIYKELVTARDSAVLFDNTRQLYATEAEEYFFYFPSVCGKNWLGIAI